MQSRILSKIARNCRLQWEESWLGQSRWTNNNAESANNLLKVKIDWKPERITDLTNHLEELVKKQYTDLQRAMFGQGDYQLAPQFSRHYISYSKWMSTTPDRQEQLIKSFMSDAGVRVEASTTVTSTDGKLTVTGSPKVARKKNQLRRPRAERTSAKAE